jgi:hypothetical protein
VTVPECDMAIATHAGNHNDVDRSYGALASFVAEYAVGVDGPIRVFYLVGSRQSTDESRWRTEIGWSIFKTEHDPSSIPLAGDWPRRCSGPKTADEPSRGLIRGRRSVCIKSRFPDP